MKFLKPMTALVVAGALAASGCTTNPQTGKSELNKTALWGIGAAVTCGIVGAAVDGGKGARNAALACGAIGAGVGAYMDHQEKLLREKLANTSIQIERVGDQIKLVMPEDITFALNSYSLNNNAVRSLDDVAQVLSKYTDTSITVAGYTDSTGSMSYNQTLSERRARSVANVLQNDGVASSRISVIGYGPRNPVASNDTAAGRSKNRRVEIWVNPKQN